MKSSSHLRLTALILLSLTVIFCLVGCSAKTDIGTVDDLTEDFLDLLLINDYDGAYAMVKQSVRPDEFEPYWDLMRQTADGATSYELKQIGWNINTKNGTTMRTAAFEVVLNNGRILFFRTTLINGVEGICGIFFNDTTEFSTTYGVYAKIANIVLMILSLLTVAFTIWMIVDCARRRIAKKPLWIILILLGFTLTVTVGQQFGFRFCVGLFLMFSGAVADPSILSVTVKLIFPIGSLLYFFLRKRLTLSQPPAQTEALPPQKDTNEN